jgi:hypothetical protein
MGKRDAGPIAFLASTGVAQLTEWKVKRGHGLLETIREIRPRGALPFPPAR